MNAPSTRPSPSTLLRFALLTSLALSFSGCDVPNESNPECIAGESRGCTCDDGTPGALVCNETGFFLPCASDGLTCVATAMPSGPDTSPAPDGGPVDTGPDVPPVEPGPSVACPFPGGEAIATLLEGPGPDSYPVRFYGDGGLDTVAGLDCEYMGTEPDDQWCRDNYTCGGCEVRVFGRPGESENWVFTTGSSGNDACAPVEGAYDVTSCTRDCTDRACGDDGCGGSCGTCPFDQTCASATGKCFEDPCTVCIRECPPGANCCQCGDGCVCGSACAARCPP